MLGFSVSLFVFLFGQKNINKIRRIKFVAGGFVDVDATRSNMANGGMRYGMKFLSEVKC